LSDIHTTEIQKFHQKSQKMPSPKKVIQKVRNHQKKVERSQKKVAKSWKKSQKSRKKLKKSQKKS